VYIKFQEDIQESHKLTQSVITLELQKFDSLLQKKNLKKSGR